MWCMRTIADRRRTTGSIRLWPILVVILIGVLLGIATEVALA
jgi:hypothetical protein